jgi:hypothetical protein
MDIIYFIIEIMRVKSVIVLLAIIFSALSPVSVHLAIAHGETSIGTFDICHGGSTALSTSHDSPGVSEPLYCPCLPSYKDGAGILEPTRKPYLSTFQDEHPPKI